MKFKLGDHVRVITRKYGDSQFGKEGIITDRDVPPGWLSVQFKDDYNSYRSPDLEFVDGPW